MIIYLDIVIFLNFVINYCFMQLIYILLNEKENKSRIIISSLCSILILFVFLLDYIIFYIIKILGGIILVSLAFKYYNKKRWIISVCLYYILQFSFIGVLSTFNIEGCLCILFLLLICLFVLLAFKRKQFINQKYQVLIKLREYELNLEGYLDTGNIASYYNRPIIFLDKKYYNNSLNVDVITSIKTIKGIEYINCYVPDRFEIIYDGKKITKDVLIAFSDFNSNISCLLNNLLFL